MLDVTQIPQLTAFGSYAVDVPWHHLQRWLDDFAQNEGLELQPDFQRCHVWTDEQRARYIEFRLRGGRSAGDILWNCPGFQDRLKKRGPMQCVDGLQRVTAVQMFLADQVRIFADLDPRRLGYVFSETNHDRMRLWCSLRMHVNDLPTREAVLRWYLEINDAGTPHTAEEIARVRALYNAARDQASSE